MDWQNVRQALLTMRPLLPTALASVEHTGIYAWWDLKGALQYPQGFPIVDIQKPLYIGLAERQGLDKRGIRMHLQSTRMSGLRRNLTPLLVDKLGLLDGAIAFPKRKFSLSAEKEIALTGWMLENLSVTWVLDPAPSRVEAILIDNLLPPLNSQYAHRGEYWSHTDRLRADFHRAARAQRVE